MDLIRGYTGKRAVEVTLTQVDNGPSLVQARCQYRDHQRSLKRAGAWVVEHYISGLCRSEILLRNTSLFHLLGIQKLLTYSTHSRCTRLFSI